LYRNDYADEELAHISSTEIGFYQPAIGVLMRSVVTYGYYVRETNPQQQVVEVLRRFGLFVSDTISTLFALQWFIVTSI